MKINSNNQKTIDCVNEYVDLEIAHPNVFERNKVKNDVLTGVNKKYKNLCTNEDNDIWNEKYVLALSSEKAASENRIKKLICFATGSIGNIPGRFEPIETTREKLKKDGLKETVNRVPQKWFVEGDKAKYYYFCENAVKNISIETADNALVAMKNWRGYENLKNIKQDTLIIWGDKDVSYNFDQVDTLKKNISSSQLEIFKGCGHNVHLEESQKFNETVKNFLS